MKTVYHEYFHGITLNEESYRNSFRGYMHEQMIKKMLIEIGFMIPQTEKEIVLLNGLIKGHTDGENIRRELIEIKSMKREKYDRVLETDRLPWDVFKQVQNYMYHGNYNNCYVVICCTETTRFQVYPVMIDLNLSQEHTENMYNIQYAINTEKEPSCNCYKCKNQKAK